MNNTIQDNTVTEFLLQDKTYRFSRPRTIAEIRDMVTNALMSRGLYNLSVSVSLASKSGVANVNVTLPYLSELDDPQW